MRSRMPPSRSRRRTPESGPTGWPHCDVRVARRFVRSAVRVCWRSDHGDGGSRQLAGATPHEYQAVRTLERGADGKWADPSADVDNPDHPT